MSTRLPTREYPSREVFDLRLRGSRPGLHRSCTNDGPQLGLASVRTGPDGHAHGSNQVSVEVFIGDGKIAIPLVLGRSVPELMSVMSSGSGVLKSDLKCPVLPGEEGLYMTTVCFLVATLSLVVRGRDDGALECALTSRHKSQRSPTIFHLWCLGTPQRRI